MMSTPWARAATAQLASHAVIVGRPGVSRARVSLARSLSPITITVRREAESAATAAIEPAFRTAFGVSIIAQIRVFSGAPASRSTRAAAMIAPGPSTLGKRIASGPAAEAAARSSSPHGVCGPLTRMTTSRPPKPPLRTASVTCPRAATFWSGATESSRSRMRASAGKVEAFANALALEPGM